MLTALPNIALAYVTKTLIQLKLCLFYARSNFLIGNATLPIIGQVDRSSATKAKDSGSIPSRDKAKTTKIGIHSLPAWRSAIKGTV